MNHRHSVDRDPVSLRRTQGDLLMVEPEGFRRYVAHLVLWIGIAIVAFSGLSRIRRLHQDNALIANGQMSLLPGGHFLETYYKTIFIGSSGLDARAGRHHAVQLIRDGDADRARQDRDLDHLRLCHRLFSLSVPDADLLDHLHHADAAGRGAHLSDLQDRRRFAFARQLRRPFAAADCVGHSNPFVPAVSS